MSPTIVFFVGQNIFGRLNFFSLRQFLSIYCLWKLVGFAVSPQKSIVLDLGIRIQSKTNFQINHQTLVPHSHPHTRNPVPLFCVCSTHRHCHFITYHRDNRIDDRARTHSSYHTLLERRKEKSHRANTEYPISSTINICLFSFSSMELCCTSTHTILLLFPPFAFVQRIFLFWLVIVLVWHRREASEKIWFLFSSFSIVVRTNGWIKKKARQRAPCQRFTAWDELLEVQFIKCIHSVNMNWEWYGYMDGWRWSGDWKEG